MFLEQTFKEMSQEFRKSFAIALILGSGIAYITTHGGWW